MAIGCIGCDANCFDRYVIDGCVGHTGGVYDSLGITDNMSLKQINQKLAEAIIVFPSLAGILAFKANPISTGVPG